MFEEVVLHNFQGLEQTNIAADAPLPAGKHQVRMSSCTTAAVLAKVARGLN
jgi:hypothetical protein